MKKLYMLVVILPFFLLKDAYSHDVEGFSHTGESGILQRLEKLEHDTYELKKLNEERKATFHSEIVGTPGNEGWQCNNIESGSRKIFCGLRRDSLEIKRKALVVVTVQGHFRKNSHETQNTGFAIRTDYINKANNRQYALRPLSNPRSYSTGFYWFRSPGKKSLDVYSSTYDDTGFSGRELTLRRNIRESNGVNRNIWDVKKLVVENKTHWFPYSYVSSGILVKGKYDLFPRIIKQSAEANEDLDNVFDFNGATMQINVIPVD